MNATETYEKARLDTGMTDDITQLRAQLARATMERDAAVEAADHAELARQQMFDSFRDLRTQVWKLDELINAAPKIVMLPEPESLIAEQPALDLEEYGRWQAKVIEARGTIATPAREFGSMIAHVQTLVAKLHWETNADLKDLHVMLDAMAEKLAGFYVTKAG